MKQPLIVIGGPTACGKTETAINLALKINGEIISADSMQVYKKMDIGTAKPTQEELLKVKHYLIDEIDPTDEYSVAIFKNKALEYINLIYSKGKIPIVVGGTGFYINALIYNNDFNEELESNSSYRKYLYKIYETEGKDTLYNMLKNIDPDSAEKIHINNIKRIIRALEYYNETGKKISDHNKLEKQREEAFNTQFFILNMDREKLYDRIELRIDKMIEDGLVQEVSDLIKYIPNNSVSMQGIGYKEIIEYLQGKNSLEEAISNLKQNTRHFAKRQITWFKNQTKGNWINADEFDNNELLTRKIISLLNI